MLVSPGFFAALSGLLASYDFDIRLGKVFSYGSEPESSRPGKIIDYLVLGHAVPGILTPGFQAGLLADLERLIALLRARENKELRVDLYRRIGAYLSRKASQEPSTTGNPKQRRCIPRVPLVERYGIAARHLRILPGGGWPLDTRPRRPGNCSESFWR